LISVAIATYNGEKYIKKQLESIKNQILPVDEVVICDDGSTDETVSICRDFIRENSLNNWAVFENEKNGGFCLNFYGAIRKTTGDIIFICDQDDEWLPEKTEKMVRCLSENPEIKVLASRYDIIDENSFVLPDFKVTYMGDRLDGSLEYLTPESFIGCSYIRGFSMCIRAEIKPKIKDIDLKDLMAHDWLLCMLGCALGKTAVLNEKLTHYRYHKDNVSLRAMNKEHRVRRLDKRISGISQSVEGHKYLLQVFNDERLLRDIERFVKFEEKRLRFLKSKNIFTYIFLAFYIKEYNRYYKGNGIRVYFGDLAYAFK